MPEAALIAVIAVNRELPPNVNSYVFVSLRSLNWFLKNKK